MDLQTLLSLPAVAHARALLHTNDAATLAEQIELAQIPAPPLEEAARAASVRERFIGSGLIEVRIDAVGNVIGRLPNPGDPGRPAAGAPVVLAAHLDTVFPADTDLSVRRNERRIHAPGIADNARGLAALLALARTLAECRIGTATPLFFIATVGEEGVGDLRGVKHLFRDESPFRAARAFISLDGPGMRRIVHRAVGSRRLRIAIHGPGGHSWADWGAANPIAAIGAVIAEICTLDLPFSPKTTLSATRIGGGTGVNTLPPESWVDLDLRSEDSEALFRVEKTVRETADRVVKAANARRRKGTPALRLTITPIGDRPAGATPAASPLVSAAAGATRALGAQPALVASSTDANVPISLGIPAITLGAGGKAGGIHTTDEWYGNENGPRGIERALLTVLAVAGVG